MFFPNIAYADVDSFIANVNTLIINPLIAFMFGIAIVLFLYGTFNFVANADNEESRTTGKKHMLFGIIGICIMMGVFTILRFVASTVNVDEVEITPDGHIDVKI